LIRAVTFGQLRTAAGEGISCRHACACACARADASCAAPWPAAARCAFVEPCAKLSGPCLPSLDRLPRLVEAGAQRSDLRRRVRGRGADQAERPQAGRQTTHPGCTSGGRRGRRRRFPEGSSGHRICAQRSTGSPGREGHWAPNGESTCGDVPASPAGPAAHGERSRRDL